MIKDLQDLELFSEGGLVEYQGKMYSLTEEPPPGVECETGTIEVSPVPAIRRSVGVGIQRPKPYLPLTEASVAEATFENGRMVDVDGYLPDSTSRFYKLVKSYPAWQSSFLEDDKKQIFCIRNGCESCGLNCEIDLIEDIAQDPDRRVYTVASLDVSAQEPVLITMLSAETVWLEVFRNRHHLKNQFCKYVEVVISNALGLDFDKITNHKGWEWVEELWFDVDRRQKVSEFNLLVHKLKNQNVTSPRLEELMRWLVQDFIDFTGWKANS